MKKVGIIRCQQTEDICTGGTDFKVASEGSGAFINIGLVEVVGFVSCGGCPGKRAIARAKLIIDQGADFIALSSCITKRTPIDYYPCPHAKNMIEAIVKKIGNEKLIEYTH